MFAIRFTLVTLLLALIFTNHLVAPKAANAGSKSAIPLSENEAKGFLRRNEPGIMRRDNEQGEYGETGDTQEFGEQNEQDEQ
ncbi:hypothetical protein ACROYT_G030789 [Oculina patagonica]